MIKRFLAIKGADRLGQQSGDKISHSVRIPLKQSPIKLTHIRPAHHILKPAPDLILIYTVYFEIRNPHSQKYIFTLKTLRYFPHISGKKQEIPQVLLVLMNIVIGDVFMDFLFDRAKRERCKTV